MKVFTPRLSPPDPRINQSPRRWEFTCVKRLLDRLKLLHVQKSVSQGVIIAGNDSIFISYKKKRERGSVIADLKRIRFIKYKIIHTRCLMIIGMISSKAIDISGKRAKPAPKKDASSRRYQLINHSVKIRIDALQLL
jgi:hypothetical protein